MSFAVVGGAVIAGGAAVYASRQASNASGSAANRALTVEQQQAEQNRADLAPWRSLGESAINDINRLAGRPTAATGGGFDAAKYLQDNPDVAAGVWSSQNPQEHYERFGKAEGRAMPVVAGTPGSAGGAPDMSSFFASPDYQFRLEQGQKALGNSLVARSGALSGRAAIEAQRLGQGEASAEYGNYLNRLYAQAGIGQAATNTGIQAGSNSTGNVTNILQNAGQQRASAYTMGAQGVNSAVQGGLQNYMLQQYLKKPSYNTPPFVGPQ